jgi:hypothetical protein
MVFTSLGRMAELVNLHSTIVARNKLLRAGRMLLDDNVGDMGPGGTTDGRIRFLHTERSIA